MVSGVECQGMVLGLLAAGQNAEAVLERLDPPRRAAAVMALLGIVITGLLLVTCVMLGANWVRRIARHRPNTTHRVESARAPTENRRLRDALSNILPNSSSQDTLSGGNDSGETKLGP